MEYEDKIAQLVHDKELSILKELMERADAFRRCGCHKCLLEADLIDESVIREYVRTHPPEWDFQDD